MSSDTNSLPKDVRDAIYRISRRHETPIPYTLILTTAGRIIEEDLCEKSGIPPILMRVIAIKYYDGVLTKT
jgi:hypothetical protein